MDNPLVNIFSNVSLVFGVLFLIIALIATYGHLNYWSNKSLQRLKDTAMGYSRTFYLKRWWGLTILCAVVYFSL